MANFDGSYWSEEGKFQALYTELNKLIPVEGSCPNPRGANKKLEKLRVAANAYYDLFNNGGINRMGLIRRIFNLPRSVYYFQGRGGQFYWPRALMNTEPMMDQIILEAAEEQGLLAEGTANSILVIVT